jgi:transcriptional regulator with AAA-type ATPase domain
MPSRPAERAPEAGDRLRDPSRIDAGSIGSFGPSRVIHLACYIREVSDARTTPYRIQSIPVKTVRLEVVKGPDAGKSLVSSADSIAIGSAEGNDLVLTDDTVSRYHADILRVDQRIVVQDNGSTNGTSLGAVLIERAYVPPGTVLSFGRSAIRIEDGDIVDCEIHEDDRLGRIRGRTPAMRRLMASVRRAAKTDASVLILGETGTGKEVLAHAIHDASARADRPFETVDCGSLLPTLIASELFGHEKGAFTGADQKHVGAFERADGGTLFLDEIGELPVTLQSMLLGALERRSFRRVGGTKPITVDVRVVAATNRDLRHEVNVATFREDLYYRIAVVMLRVPPLRERVDDIPLLIEDFVKSVGHPGSMEEAIPAQVMESLKHHRWPGNVRELRNFVEAAVAMGEAPVLGVREGEAARGGLTAKVALTNFEGRTYREVRDAVLREFEQLYFSQLMQRMNGRVSDAAKEADMDRTYLGQVLKRLGLRP